MDNLPYKYWTRDELYKHCERQCRDYGAENLLIELRKIVLDVRWNPTLDYNGCNIIQDKYHPYVPCLIHDFDWLVGDGGYKTDVEFRKNLERFGTSKNKSFLMFLGVRIGWLFWYKWGKKLKKAKKRKMK